MKGVANWIMVIGGVIIGLTLFFVSVNLIIRQIRTNQKQTVLGKMQNFHGQLVTACKMGLGHKKNYELTLPDTVRAVYVGNETYESPPDKVSVMVSNRDKAVGNHTCIQFFDDNLPICQYIGCYASMTYMGSPSLKSNLQTLISRIKGEYPVYEYTVEIEKSDEYFLDVTGGLGR